MDAFRESILDLILEANESGTFTWKEEPFQDPVHVTRTSDVVTILVSKGDEPRLHRSFGFDTKTIGEMKDGRLGLLFVRESSAGVYFRIRRPTLLAQLLTA